MQIAQSRAGGKEGRKAGKQGGRGMKSESRLPLASFIAADLMKYAELAKLQHKLSHSAAEYASR